MVQVAKQAPLLDSYLRGMRREINPSKEYEEITRRILSRIDITTATEEDIANFLDTLRRPQSIDPMHKWIGTYNNYLIVFKRFFKWKGTPLTNLKKLKRKEKSIYKPSDLWTEEDDLIFLKYCPSKRDKCYHAMSRDTSCRPSELLDLRVKDVVFKMVGYRQYAEVLVNGKTGSRHIPLINSLPYLKAWLNEHPHKNPDAPLFDKLTTQIWLWKIYTKKYKRSYFPGLLNDRNVPKQDKEIITALLAKPWNPYIRRHSALTDKSKFLKEHILRQHAGWSSRSNMPEKYLHYFGNESSESILEMHGLRSKTQEKQLLLPKQCPNCNEPNESTATFCCKCRMILTYSEYHRLEEEGQRIDKLEEMLKEISSKL